MVFLFLYLDVVKRNRGCLVRTISFILKFFFMKFLQPFLFISAIVCFSFTTTDTQQWVLIGERKVNFLIDRDVIQVKGNDNYSQLKIKVKDGPVQIKDMDVHFENGDKFDVSLKQKMAQGTESRVIDLPGGSRNVKKIEFWYETRGFRKGRSTVEVWGKR